MKLDDFAVVVGGQVDDDRAGRRNRQQAVLTGQDRAYRPAVGQAEKNQVALLRQGRRADGDGGIEPLAFRGCPVPDRQVVSAVDKATGNRLAKVPQADKSDVHSSLP